MNLGRRWPRCLKRPTLLSPKDQWSIFPQSTALPPLLRLAPASPPDPPPGRGWGCLCDVTPPASHQPGEDMQELSEAAGNELCQLMWESGHTAPKPELVSGADARPGQDPSCEALGVGGVRDLSQYVDLSADLKFFLGWGSVSKNIRNLDSPFPCTVDPSARGHMFERKTGLTSSSKSESNKVRLPLGTEDTPYLIRLDFETQVGQVKCSCPTFGLFCSSSRKPGEGGGECREGTSWCFDYLELHCYGCRGTHVWPK